MPYDEEVHSDSTKSNSDYCLMSDFTDEKRVGLYTLRERREKIKKYKIKLQKYKLGLSKHRSNRYTKRSIIAKTKPRNRGKFAKADTKPLPAGCGTANQNH